jgi:hypothetical protein
MRKLSGLFVAAGLLGSLTACGSKPDSKSVEAPTEKAGEIEVALTNAPGDVACVRVSVVGSRTDVRKFDLTPGAKAVFKLNGLPVGNASVSADAFPVACNALVPGVDSSWYSEAVVVQIKTNSVTHVALAMIHNGKATVGVDFDDNNAPTQPADPTGQGGTCSTSRPYMIPVQPGAKVKVILTTGESVGGYRLVGIPDGSGAFDNGDGTFTWLVNHELGSGSGVVRAHGAKGAFVSKWQVRKSNLCVDSGADLGKQAILWNPVAKAYDPPATGIAFGRFCSADLPAPSAFYDAASGKGYDKPLFMNGEEIGSEGRGMAHDLDGNMWDLPRTGKFSWENSLANPGTGETTVVAGTDDEGGGQIYVYWGKKTNTGSPIDKAGLTNGLLCGLRVTGFPVEPATGIPSAPFDCYNFGNVENWTGGPVMGSTVPALETESNTNKVTKFNRPEDGQWHPNNPNDFYFVTTNNLAPAPTRLWRARFVDAANPLLGGKFEMLLDGTELSDDGILVNMFDNITIDKFGHVYLQEDTGSSNHLTRILRYDIATDKVFTVLKSDPLLFDNTLASPTFETTNEEASGVIDASDLLGPGWFLSTFQNHKTSPDPELVEGGQLFAFYDPESK